jgi:Tfp pilus assembly protein PilE
MKNNQGITMIALVVTIVILLILAGISIGTGNNIIKKSELENLKTNMLLIKVKGLEYVENANFNLGTSIDSVNDEEKNNRIENAKAELKGEEITETNSFLNNIGITEEEFQADNSEYIFYYRLTTENLSDMGISNLESNEKKGWYVIKYDVKNAQVEIYNETGIETDGITYYSLGEIEKLNI